MVATGILSAAGWEDLLARGLAVVVGLSLLWAAIMAAVGVMLVPRPSNQRLAVWVSGACHVVFRTIAHRARNYVQLDRYLAVQGPATVLLYLALFLFIFVGAFSFIFYGVTGCAPLEAFYRSGSSMSTLGVVNASGPGALTVMFVAAFCGTTVISVFIGFLLTLYTAYTARETYMSKIALSVGEPGWGPETVARLRRLEGALTDDEVADCVQWICAMRVSQYIYPLLNHFRSPVRNRHWVATLLAVLDATAIRAAAIEGKISTSSARLLAQGTQAFLSLKDSELSRTSANTDGESHVVTWMIEEEMMGTKSGAGVPACGITRAEWDQAMEFLAANGIALLPDRDASWQIFSRIRARYFEPAYFLAEQLSAVNAPWSGPRHPAYEFPQEWPYLSRHYFAKDNPAA
jgi:hypothetical protein